MNTAREHSEQQMKQSRWGFRGMTVRDWLQLLIVPLALVVISFLFTTQQDQRQQHIENQRAEAERELAVQRAQDEALQAYLDQMSTLMLEKDLRNSEEDSEVRTLTQARTLTVIRRVDTSRKDEIMQFLLKADLVHRVDGSAPVIELGGADLSDTSLSGTDLEGVNLSDANLSRAHLSDVYLLNARLDFTNLSYAELSGAGLIGAYLLNSKLGGTDLSGANLSDAYLYGADLSGPPCTGLT